MKNICVVQYGYFWKLQPEQAKRALKGLIAGYGYNLMPYRELKNMPRTVKRDRDSERERYYTFSPNVFLFEPLDFDPEEAQYTLNELNDFLGE